MAESTETNIERKELFKLQKKLQIADGVGLIGLIIFGIGLTLTLYGAYYYNYYYHTSNYQPIQIIVGGVLLLLAIILMIVGCFLHANVMKKLPHGQSWNQYFYIKQAYPNEATYTTETLPAQFASPQPGGTVQYYPMAATTEHKETPQQPQMNQPNIAPDLTGNLDSSY